MPLSETIYKFNQLLNILKASILKNLCCLISDEVECIYSGWRDTLSIINQKWISKALFHFKSGKPELDLSRVHNLWWYPPQPSVHLNLPPNVINYFAEPLLLWMPATLWRVKLYCPYCPQENPKELRSSGTYQKTRHVLDVDRSYNIASEYLECKTCTRKIIGWSHNILAQLAIGHQLQWPCILTAKLACDLRIIRLLRNRGLGNSSSQIQKKIDEQHGEAHLQKTIHYLTDCSGFSEAVKKGLVDDVSFSPIPTLKPVPKHRWLMQVYSQDVLHRHEEIKASITSIFGTVLKLDSTKKVTKKLSSASAKWTTNVGNEYGQVLMTVLTGSEGYGLGRMLTGIVNRYTDASVPPPILLYVDRDCCGSASATLRRMLSPWSSLQIRLDIWHFMRRISTGCTTDSHQLYGTFMGHLSRAIFEWDDGDVRRLKEAKFNEMVASGIRHPSNNDVLKRINKSELALHCRRTTRGSDETCAILTDLIESFSGEKGRDSLGVPLIHSRMEKIWHDQKRHLSCIQVRKLMVLFLFKKFHSSSIW